MRVSLLLPFLGLLACTPFPELDQSVDRTAQTAPFPQLVPLGPLLATLPVADTFPQGPSADRIDRLRARAAALRGPVIAPSTRARMTRGVSNPF